MQRLPKEIQVSVHGVTAPLDSGVPWQELALEIAGVGVWEWDFVAGRGQWSQGLCLLLALSGDGLGIGPDGLLHFVHPDDQARYRQSILSAIEGEGDHNVEYRVLLPDKRVRWFLDRARVLRGEDGEPSKIIGAITDVTERKQEEIARRQLERIAQDRIDVEQALRDTEIRFKEILDYAPVAVYIKNLDGLLTFVNQRFLDLFNVEREDVILRDRNELHPPEILNQLREHDRLVIEAGRALQFEEVVEVGGVRQTYLSVKFPLRDHDGAPYAICGISADITDRKKAERAVNERSAALQLAVDEINQLTYSVSHEMGSPLRGVIGNIRLLREELGSKLEPSADARLKRIEKAALKMGQLVDDLLAFSRLRRKDIHIEEIDVTELAEDMIDTMKRRDDSLKDSCVQVDDQIVCSADKELLTMVLLSLLENAFKFKKPDTIPQIRIRKIDRGFCVEDEGIGLDPQYAHKIFKPFERLHRDTEFPGTGIGLAKVQRIVELHGGSLRVESEMGQGAKFFVQFRTSSPAPKANVLSA